MRGGELAVVERGGLVLRGEGGAGADISARLVSEKEKPAASPRGACKVTGAQMSQTCAVCGIPARQRCVFGLFLLVLFSCSLEYYQFRKMAANRC